MIRVGSVVGNYTIVAPLGEGAMAAVFLAEHPRIGKRVAIKVIHPELSTSQEMVSRFFTEARAVSQVRHEHVVEIQDFGQTPDGDNFIIMEYLDGDTLTARLAEQGNFDVPRTVGIAIQLCEGLAAAHGRGVVHRDLKPDNIFLIRRGNERDFVKILDFGLAKLTGGPAGEQQHRTRTGSVLGTPHYMAPEQCEGKVGVDVRADLYSLGCILYQMLTGQLPFPGEGFGEVLVRHLREMPPSVRSRNAQVSPALEKVILHCLAKRREYRFQSAGELVQALRNPESFSAAIGNNMRLIIGPMPGEPDPGGPLQMEQPPTLVGDIGGSSLLPPPPVAPPTTGSLPSVKSPATPDQRTVLGTVSPFAPQPRGGGTEILQAPEPPVLPTLVSDPYPPKSSEMPTIVPGTHVSVQRLPVSGKMRTDPGRKGRRLVAVLIGVAVALVAVGLWQLLTRVDSPRTVQVDLKGKPAEPPPSEAKRVPAPEIARPVPPDMSAPDRAPPDKPERKSHRRPPKEDGDKGNMISPF